MLDGAVVQALAASEDAEHGGLRRRSQVPAVDGPGVPAPARRASPPGSRATRSGEGGVPAFEATSGAVALGVAGRTLHAMARSGMYDQLAGGLRPVRGGRRLGRAALREDAVRQRPARAGVPALVAADRRADGRADRRGDLRLDGRRAADRRTAGSRRRSTPTRRCATPTARCTGSRATRTSGRRRSSSTSSARRTPPGRPALLRVTPQGTFEHGRSTLQLGGDVWADPVQAQRWEAGAGQAARRPRRRARSPAGTTRSSRPGTGSPSRRSRRPARCSAAPTSSRRPPGRPTCCSPSTSSPSRPAGGKPATRAPHAPGSGCGG